MTSPVTYKLTLTAREVSLVVRGLRAAEAQISTAPNRSGLQHTRDPEADEMANLRRRLTLIYNQHNIKPYPYG